MWEPYRQSLQQWAPQCQIICDKFSYFATRQPAKSMKYRGRKFSAKAPRARLDSRKSWLLLSSWIQLDRTKKWIDQLRWQQRRWKS
jgi:hypothetical protein